jgi:hypothetical protein
MSNRFKKSDLQRILLFIVVIIFSSKMIIASEKRALLVAIGKYPATSGWNDLSSVNDAELMKGVLLQQGFKISNINLLKDEKATHKNILKALDQMIAQSSLGDVLVFHFSGHGQQITDLNDDELDCYDEALIPYDAPLKPSNQYGGENHIIDDALNKYLLLLRKKVGAKGDVVFLLDACHSGTATRSANEKSIFRGTTIPFELPKKSSTKLGQDVSSFSEQPIMSNPSVENLSPFVVISASGQSELNMEIKDGNGKGYGPLTLAVGKVLSTNSSNLSYSTFFELTRNEMCTLFMGKHQQNPQLEGDINRELFGGKYNPAPNHCLVIDQINSTKVVVNMGELSGLTIGSEIHFYPINTILQQKQSVIGTGFVSKLNLYDSEVKLDTPGMNSELKGAWGFIANYKNTANYKSISEMRADIIRRASSIEPSLNVVLELIPVYSKNNTLRNQFRFDDQFQLKVSNKGTQKAFFQIIDIQPDNSVQLLTDLSQLSPNDCVIEAGESKILKFLTLTACAPAGVEMYKLIASEKQLDLSPVKTMHPVVNRSGNLSDFEQLINELFINDRGTKSVSYFNRINIYTLTFTVTEK